MDDKHETKQQRGFVCHKCGCRHFRVKKTYHNIGEQIIRSRICRHCGQKLRTVELRWEKR